MSGGRVRAGRGLAWLLVGALLSAAPSAYGMGLAPPESPYHVRVAIAQHEARVALTVRGDYRIVAWPGAAVVQAGAALPRLTVQPSAGGLDVGGTVLAAQRIRVETQRGAPILVDQRQVRGAVEIIRQADDTLLVINHVGLDAYLFGVLRHESSDQWPLEALKAQAIISRTYALYQIQRNRQQQPARDFDLVATIYSQVYGGRESERWRTNRAVRETYGQVLTYQGRLFPTYFHAACGGRTEAAAVLWGGDLPPLRGVVCPWCRAAPHYHWTREIMQRDLVGQLRAHGVTIERIADLTVVERDASGRAVRLRLDGPGGPAEVAAKNLREWLGPNWLRSLLFEVRLEGYKVVFDGRGWGHGVGLCQWGAAEQAAQGRTAGEILQFYYPGAVVQQLPAGLTAPADVPVSFITDKGGRA